ncbi:c-type cytochrome [Pontibacter ramchanderi]|uniref:Mono/diheme cytochrome c family protein n=1 Tax=Pontibacter ramchanderi TaxID=1179743 RepID=A0A2N3U7S5_9BACT|nr:cytochrome c [Pontibacter ramchanderi]PKV62807.1 mono/diheme cytochrome c family protein [Pontibacter ramchanderi]
MANPSNSLNKILSGLLPDSFRYGVVALFCGSLLLSCSSGDNENKATESQEQTGLAHQQEQAPVEDDGKGIGPVSSIEVSADIDDALAAEGKTIFEGKCSACHQLTDQKIVGPGLLGVTEKRKPEWIMNMVINPEEMTKKDPTAKKLLAEHLTQMTNQNINEKDARAILEFLRQNDLQAQGK